MKTFEIIEYKKDTTIFVYGKAPYNVFFVIIEGNVSVENYLIDNGNYVLDEGYFVGLVSALSNEPYYSTARALNDVKLMAIEIKDLEKLASNPMMEKIFNFLILRLETWTSKYLNAISKYIAGKGYKLGSMIDIAKYYDKNGYYNAAYYMYNKYLKSFENMQNVSDIERRLSELSPYMGKTHLENNIEEYKKGECIFCEHEHDTDIYMIKSGKVSLYNVFHGARLTQMTFLKGGVFGYKSVLGSNMQTSTAIVVENSILQRISKETFMNMIKNDIDFKLSIMKIIARRVWILTVKMESISIKSSIGKLYNLLYSLAKAEISPNDRKSFSENANTEQDIFSNENHHFVKLPYTINEIMDMVGLFHSERTSVMNALSKSRYIKINEDSVIVNDIKTLKKELYLYKRFM